MDYSISSLALDSVDEIVSTISTALQEDFPEYQLETIRSYRQNIFNKKYFTKLLKDDSNKVFGAYLENKLTGLIVIKGEYGGVIFIDWLVVKKPFRNLGIGTFLLAKTEDWALKNNFHYAYLMTESAKNINYYKNRGFSSVGKHSNSWFGEDEYIMGKSYHPQPFPKIFAH